MEKYKFFDHTADVLFEAYGKNLNELFEHAALALEETQVDVNGVNQNESRTIHLKNDSVEMLLFYFLQELIFFKDFEKILFSKFKLNITENKIYRLSAECLGEVINLEKHELKVDVKAVTLHTFSVEKTKKIWKARVLLDV